MRNQCWWQSLALIFESMCFISTKSVRYYCKTRVSLHACSLPSHIHCVQLWSALIHLVSAPFSSEVIAGGSHHLCLVKDLLRPVADRWRLAAVGFSPSLHPSIKSTQKRTSTSQYFGDINQQMPSFRWNINAREYTTYNIWISRVSIFEEMSDDIQKCQVPLNEPT